MKTLPDIPQNAATHTKMSAIGLKAFFGITHKWHLTTEQEQILLGVRTLSTFYRLKQKKTGSISPDMLERISYILGIYKALRILLPSENSANEWIHKPNSSPLFGGKSALDKMLVGRVVDLADVRRYLDAERGW